MVNEFKAELKDGKLIVKAIRKEDKDGNVTLTIPSFPLIQKLIKEKKPKDKE